MRVAVTGGSGVVGRAVVRHLVSDGHEVRALARSSGSSRLLESMGVSVVLGDVLDQSSVQRLVDGCECVFHIAGVNEMCVRDPTYMWNVNVEATLGVLAACSGAGVRRLVHTSSAVTIGEEPGTVGSETSSHRGYFLSEYERSKTLAERLVFERSGDLEAIAVNPASVQGPGRSTGTGALLLAVARNSLPALVDAIFSMVDIDDCARGHLLAADRGSPGERYILSGATLTVRQVVRRLSRLLERQRSPWFLRPAALTAMAPLVAGISRLLGSRSPLCPESARVLRNGHHYDGSHASRDLGLQYTPLDETLAKTVAWFRDEGLIRDN